MPDRGRVIEVRPNPGTTERYQHNLALVTEYDREGDRRVILGLGPQADSVSWPHGWYLVEDVSEWRYTKIKRLYKTKEDWYTVRSMDSRRILYKGERRSRITGPMVEPHGVVTVNLTVVSNDLNDINKTMVILRENLDALIQNISVLPEEILIEAFDHDCQGCANTRELNRVALIDKSRVKIRELLELRDSLREAWKEEFNDNNLTTYLIPWLERLAPE